MRVRSTNNSRMEDEAMEKDVFKMLRDLELKAVGLDEQTKKMQEGYFVAFRTIGLPIHKEDDSNPWTPSNAEIS